MIQINNLRERFISNNTIRNNIENYTELNTSEYDTQYLKMIKTFHAFSEIYEFNLVYLVQPHDIRDLDYSDHLINQNSFNDVLRSFVENIETDERPYLIDLDTKFTEFMFEGDVLNLQHLQALMKKIRSKKFVNSCVRIINDAKSKNEKTNY